MYQNITPTSSNTTPSSTNHTPQLTPPPHSERLQDFIRNHRALSLTAFLALFLGLLAILMLIINILHPTIPETTTDPEVAPLPYYKHQYLLDESLGDTIAADITVDIADIILSNTELNSAPHGNDVPEDIVENQYIITIDELSYRRTMVDSDMVFTVNLNISDGRTYTLHIRIDPEYGAYHIVVVLDRTDSPSIQDTILTYTINPDTPSINLTNWAEQTYILNNPIIKNLELPDYYSLRSSDTEQDTE